MKCTKNTMIAACIMLSAAGILLIAAIDLTGTEKEVNISQINSGISGENIITCGNVKSKSISPSGTAFIVLGNGTSKIRAVFFKNELHEVENATRGSDFCLKGTIKIYNGTAEIIGKKKVIFKH